MERTRTFVFILMLALSQELFAREIREFYHSPRSLAMGGASIAVVNDETALLHNPAGLGKLRDFYGTLVDPDIDASGNDSALYKGQAISNPLEPPDVYASLSKAPDSYYYFRGQLFPSIVVKNFGFGIFLRRQLSAELDTTATKMDTRYWSDYAALLGYNLRIWEGRIKIGVVGKAISRVEIDKELDVTGDLSIGTNAAEGTGLGLDAALMLAAPWTWIPTLAVVVRDVGGTKFDQGAGMQMQSTERPNQLEQDMDVGISVSPIHGNRSRSQFTIEYQKLKESQTATDKLLYAHVGYEFNYADVFFFRLGMNQRYATGGIEIASEHTQLQLSTYGEEIGTSPTVKEDRRYNLKFTFRF